MTLGSKIRLKPLAIVDRKFVTTIGWLARRAVFVFMGLVFLAGTVDVEARNVACAKVLKDLLGGDKALKVEVEKRLAQKLAAWLTRFSRVPTLSEFSSFAGVSETEFRTYMKQHLKSTSMEDFFDRSMKVAPFEFEVLGDSLAKSYAKLAKERMREVDLETFASSLEIDAKVLVRLIGKGRVFESFEALQAHARDLKPEDFKKVIGDEFLSEEHRARVLNAVAKHSTYIVTTAGSYDRLHEGFYATLVKAAEEMDAIIIVRPANFETDGLDPRLLNHPRIFVSLDGIGLGETANLNEIQILKKMLNQLTGIERLGPRGQIQVVGGTHLEVKTQATANNSDRPHIMMTTGAITVANNAGDKPVQRRTDKLGNELHKLGAVIVTRGNRGPEDFFVRQIEYKESPEGGGFMDLNRFYTAKGSKKIKIPTLVLGDIHVGDTDPKVLESLPKVLSEYDPETIVIHDLFNGHSINRHDIDKAATLAQKYKSGRLDLAKEIKENQDFLAWLLSLHPTAKIKVIKSNHDLFLNKWLETGNFARDPINAEIGARLFARMVNTKLPDAERDPLKFALFDNANFDISRVEILDVGESREIGPEGDPVQIGYHGHVAENGRPGSANQFYRSGRNIITGHTHTVWRFNDAVGVGTFTKHMVGYNKDGMSNWVQSMVLVGPNGEKQILVFRDGWWYAEQTTDSAKNFSKDFPTLIRHEVSPDGMGQVDQYVQSSRRRR